MDNNIPVNLMETFLAMLGDENNAIPFYGQANAEVDAKFDDEMQKVALALSPMDDGSQVQNPSSLPRIDLEMINAVIGEGIEQGLVQGLVQGIQMDGVAHASPVTQEYLYPLTSPHLYDTTNFVYVDQNEEVPQAQAVPVQNPSAMISGVIPQPQIVTIDQSQLQDSLMSQPMSVDPPESTSMDQSDVMDSMTEEDASEDVPSPDPGSETQTVEEEEHRERGSKVEEPPTLPDFSELLIRIRYRSQEVVREQIKNACGCLVYYSKPWTFQDRKSGFNPAAVQFPDITLTQRSDMTDSQFRFTEQVLKALEKGLFLRCDIHGNVYATRYCRSKIFWYSTEKGPIADSQITGNVPNLTFQKLERNEEVMVFDNVLFQRKLFHYVVNKPTFKNEAARALPNMHTIPISPAIFFTFAQSWNPLNSALSSCLVSMVVNPVRARIQRQWGNDDRHESHDLSTYALQISNTDSHEKS